MYGNPHRRFLQCMMSRGMVTCEEGMKMMEDFYSIEQNPPQNANFESFLQEINAKIRPLNMEIKLGFCELTGKRYYALIVTANNAITRSSIAYAANELELFKKIIEEIATSEDGHISTTACLNLCSRLPKDMSKSEAQKVMAKFAQDKWLIQHNGKLYLTVRSILELEPHLREAYGEYLQNCPLCNQLVFQGLSCAFCGIKSHKHCLEKYFQRRSQPMCPDCHKDWPNAEELMRVPEEDGPSPSIRPRR